jgi:large subunit ribosomal protein L21
MYAVLSSGGKQYRVEAGTTLELERLAAEPGATVTFDRVLLLADGDRVTVGTPLVQGATVSATVLGQALGPKLIIFKFRQKVKYRRRRGHRQQLTRVRIDAINADERRPTRAEAAAEPAEQAAPPDEAAPTVEAAGPPAVETAPEAETTEKVERKPPARRRTATKAAKPDVEAAEDAEPKATEAAETTAAEPAAEEKPKARRTTRPKKSTTAEPAEEK